MNITWKKRYNRLYNGFIAYKVVIISFYCNVYYLLGNKHEFLSNQKLTKLCKNWKERKPNIKRQYAAWMLP